MFVIYLLVNLSTVFFFFFFLVLLLLFFFIILSALTVSLTCFPSISLTHIPPPLFLFFLLSVLQSPSISLSLSLAPSSPINLIFHFFSPLFSSVSHLSFSLFLYLSVLEFPSFSFLPPLARSLFFIISPSLFFIISPSLFSPSHCLFSANVIVVSASG